MLAALLKGKEADFRWKEQHQQSTNILGVNILGGGGPGGGWGELGLDM